MSRRLDDLHPTFRPAAMELLARFTEAGIPVLIIDTLRTQAEHEANLAAGRSWTRRSKHCLSQDHRVLTSDLAWRSGGDIAVGESLLAFDEAPVAHGRRRRFQNSTVMASEPEMADVMRVELEDGSVIHATPEHRWLVDSGFGFHWVETRQLRRGPRLRSALVKVLDVFGPAVSYDAGWLAGFIDGEGSLGRDGSVSVSQRPGPIMDRAESIARALGYQVSIASSGGGGLGKGDCLTMRINGPWATRLQFLGRVRPQRLLSKFMGMEHSFQGSQRAKVMAVEKAGRRDIVKMQTTSGTFIADGYGMHNCDGLAIDVCPYEVFQIDGPDKLQWSAGHPVWQKMGAVAAKYLPVLIWGGTWAQRDLGHWEWPQRI